MFGLRSECANKLGMLITVFWANQLLVIENRFQTDFWLLKTGFKPIFGFISLHTNLSFKPS